MKGLSGGPSVIARSPCDEAIQGVESAVVGRSPICHTRESGYPVGHDEAAQDSIAER